MMKNRTLCLIPLFLISFHSLIFVINSLVVANSPLASSQRQSLCHDHEKLALLQFKHNFLIDCDASDPGFARPKVNSWWESSSNDDTANGTTRTSDCCMWDGVKCNNETGHVIGLDLSSSCLSGTFPRNSTLLGLKHLQELDLSNNEFNYSPIPATLGRLSQLTHLNLSMSDFSGQIPLEVSELSSLSVLDLSDNYGLELHSDQTFHQMVCNLSNLTILHLDEVDIASDVPVVLSNFTSLTSLSLGHCNLYGDFPTGIFLLPNLELLDLQYNPDLEGFLPEFPFHSHLTYLGIVQTPFSGKLTSSIGRLNRLTVLNLWASAFTGKIPSSLGNLTKLNSLNLALNYFEGSLPIPVTNLTQLTDLSLSNLNVTLEMLNCWLLKNNLEDLTLSHGMLSHEIPQAISNLTRLFWLDLRSNRLMGSLPIVLANLTQLRYLDLMDNQFQGTVIPWWISKLFNLEELRLSSKGSVGMFDPLLKVPKLTNLALHDINLIFSPNTGSNTSVPKFEWLELVSCNLTKFPEFLRYQDELQVLTFPDNNIVGIIPVWLVNASAESLKAIDLYNNLLMGVEQPELFLSCTQLELVYLSSNTLHGPLPAPPVSLQNYQVSLNYLSGALPERICNASSLTNLDVSSNNLNGSLPTCLGGQLAASLHVLNLRDNRFQGKFPQTFTRACKLKMINLSENQLEGKLSKSLINCRDLEVLDVGENNLSGIFPSWLGRLPNLQALVLRQNNFQGEIANPESEHDFSSLRIIDLSNNFHTGNLPSFYIQNWSAMRVTSEENPISSYSVIGTNIRAGGIELYNIDPPFFYEITITNKGTARLIPKIWSVFRAVDFSSNNFTGGIPDILGSLRGLQALNLSNNHLSGDIPSSLTNLIDLEALDLSQNMLIGEIPQKFNKISNLEIFNVSHNRLKGPIPQGQQFNTFDNTSFDGNLALCGAPLPNTCGKTNFVAPPQMTDNRAKEDSKLIDWIIRSLGCMSGCIVGFIVGKIFITDPHSDWFVDRFGSRRMSKTRARRYAPSRRRN